MHPSNIIQKEESGDPQGYSFKSVTEYAYPHIKVTVEKYTSDEIKEWLG